MKKIQSKYYSIEYNDERIRLKNRNNGVVIIPVTEKNEIILLKIYRECVSSLELEVPRGFIEENEEAKEAAIRELKEELNSTAEEMIDLGEIYPDSGVMDSKIKIFLAKKCSVDKLKVQEKENIKDYKITEINEVLSLINKGQIKDGFTISAILKMVLSMEDWKLKNGF